MSGLRIRPTAQRSALARARDRGLRVLRWLAEYRPLPATQWPFSFVLRLSNQGIQL